jgi:general secretion pathway protein H
MVRANGFTLIELLIVIVIISIISSVALLTITHNQNKNIENFAHELIQIMTLAEHEAMLRPATLGLGLTKKTYQFYIYNSSSKWELFLDKNLGNHTIPNNIQVVLKINDKIVALNAKPAIVISSSSDMTPFTILLGEPGKHPIYQVIGEANGNLKSEPVNEE